ncbi:UTP--glucose-1-phosphate uridylyltransferase [Paraliomyxa miuraensis]|uniref:UTP--glucose-1-phosphate uridylyltransferase n=1 Tax=Paraliomyxa miuraensis TaxID=376150 RepID=UPI002255CA20|nr:UTP--glucose-1-phosphate uridylyltransferase [Paraliomyxa miuraensis]MCX4248004.1 UTP--glucose-1-phosphate uridylyltransferase [Paraliomyxa miuraensis]
MDVRPSLASFSFDAARFDELRQRVSSGVLDPSANRLATAPTPLTKPPVDLRPGADEARTAQRRARLGAKGEAALRAGKVGILVLNGGMATRFGGGAKGVVPVVEDHPRASFLAVKLGQVRVAAERLGARIPVVLMHSFATQGASEAHLAEIDWSGVNPGDRDAFSQSIMPRVLPDGTPLPELSGASELPDADLYCAPGHGDTLGRLRGSGALGRLQARGVEHLLISNVDNLGASLDPVVLGAHLEAVEGGAGVSVEVVRREAGDAGGCVAQLEDGTGAIVEAFRLPEGVDLVDYPHFNTNTLWVTTEAADREVPLTWFAVRKRIEWPDASRVGADGKLEVVQFERLIGQITETVKSAYLEVDRTARFCPIKVREDLQKEADVLRTFAREAGVIS